MKIRATICRALAALVLLTPFAPRAAAHEFGDDYGDSAAFAKAIVVGSNYSGTIEIDIDQDWFAFQATNSLKQYVVTVTTGTLWNAGESLAAADGVSVVAATNLVATNAAQVSWIHVGPPATYYVAVSGFAAFTTGTYSLVVSQQNFVDQNHNGIPDAWEIASFGSTNQPAAGDYDRDGMSNLSEFLAGTNPTNRNSKLQLVGIAAGAPGATVTWNAAVYRTYEVDVSTNLSNSGVWTPLGVVTNFGTPGPLSLIDPTTPRPPVRFYRIGCLY